MSIHPREGHLGPADMDSITGMLQQCLHFQRDLSERWEKETVKHDKRWSQMLIDLRAEHIAAAIFTRAGEEEQVS